MSACVKYILAISVMALTAASHGQNIVKHKDDFGLICPNGMSSKAILYSPKNKVASIGYIQDATYKHTGKINSETIKKTADEIIFTAYDHPMLVDFKINRAELFVQYRSYASIAKYDSDLRPYRVPVEAVGIYYCNLMTDEDFIETIKYDLAQNPLPVASPPAQKPKNKL